MHAEIDIRSARGLCGGLAKPGAWHHHRSAGEEPISVQFVECDVRAMAHADVIEMRNDRTERHACYLRTKMRHARLRDALSPSASSIRVYRPFTHSAARNRAKRGPLALVLGFLKSEMTINPCSV